MIEQTFGATCAPSAAGGPARIALLVEDDTLVAMIVEESLLGLGFAPHTVLDAGSATRAMADGLDPALAVIDVGLPDERGDQLARRLRTQHPSVPVIIASGYDEAELKSRFADDPSVAVLAKPYTASDLATAVRSLGLSINAAG
jgi:DNA-binding response OmpR family regulator